MILPSSAAYLHSPPHTPQETHAQEQQPLDGRAVTTSNEREKTYEDLIKQVETLSRTNKHLHDEKQLQNREIYEFKRSLIKKDLFSKIEKSSFEEKLELVRCYWEKSQTTNEKNFSILKLLKKEKLNSEEKETLLKILKSNSSYQNMIVLTENSDPIAFMKNLCQKGIETSENTLKMHKDLSPLPREQVEIKKFKQKLLDHIIALHMWTTLFEGLSKICSLSIERFIEKIKHEKNKFFFEA